MNDKSLIDKIDEDDILDTLDWIRDSFNEDPNLGFVYTSVFVEPVLHPTKWGYAVRMSFSYKDDFDTTPPLCVVLSHEERKTTAVENALDRCESFRQSFKEFKNDMDGNPAGLHYKLKRLIGGAPA